MALTTCNVTGSFLLPDGAAQLNAVAVFALSIPEIDGAAVVPRRVRALLGAGGALDVDLWPNARGSAESVYTVTVELYADSNAARLVDTVKIGELYIPDRASADLAEVMQFAWPAPSALSVLAQTVAARNEARRLGPGPRPAGTWDASSGAFASGAVADTYYTVPEGGAGTVDGETFAVGDWLIALKDGASTTTYADNWTRGDYSKVVPRVYDDVSKILASVEVSRGTGALWQDKKGNRLIEAAAGTLAFDIDSNSSGYHLRNSAGVPFYVGQGKFELKAEAFGVDFTGDAAAAPANTAAFRTMLGWLGAEGQGGRILLASEGHAKIDNLAGWVPDGVQIDLGGSILENVRLPADYASFGSTGVISLGTVHPAHMAVQTWHKLAAVGEGDAGVTVQNAGDAANYQAGDIVLVAEAVATFAGNTLPSYGKWARVKSVSGSMIYIDYPAEKDIDAGSGTINSSAAGAWISNWSYRGWRARAAISGWIEGRPYMADRAELVNGTLINQHSSPMVGTGVHEGTLQDILAHVAEVADGQANANLFANAVSHCLVSNVRSSAYTRFGEFGKCLSQHTRFEKLDIHMVAGPHGAGEALSTPIAIGENSRHIVVADSRFHIGKPTSGATLPAPLVNFTGTEYCGFRNCEFDVDADALSLVYVRGDNVGAFVENSDFYSDGTIGFDDEGVDSRFEGNRQFGTNSTYGIRARGTAKGGRYLRNWFQGGNEIIKLTAPSSSDAIGITINGNEGVATISEDAVGRMVASGNQGAETDAIVLAGARRRQVTSGFNTSSTTEVPLGAPVVIPADLVRAGDVFEWTITGLCTGTAGTKEVSLRAAVDVNDDEAPLDASDDSNIVYTGTIPASCLRWKYVASIHVEAGTVLAVEGELFDMTNGAFIGGDYKRHTAADFANHPLRLEFSGLVANASDELSVRIIDPDFDRPGFS